MLSIDDIYYIIIGESSENENIPWVKCVDTKDSPYDLACGELREACLRLCGRLGIDPHESFEDEDIGTIIDDMLVMQQEVAWAMFACGMEFARRGFQLQE